MGHFVNVTGNIAAGATTLSRVLIETNGWVASLETDVDTENPFLRMMYEDSPRWAFHNQVFFLSQSLARHRKLAVDISQTSDVYVQDYCAYEHADVYARSLGDEGALIECEQALLKHLAGLVRPLLCRPDLLIVVHAEPSVILPRLQGRGRRSEEAVTLEHLSILDKLFRSFAHRWSDCPVVEIQSDNVDLRTDVNSRHLIADIARELLAHASLRSRSELPSWIAVRDNPQIAGELGHAGTGNA